MTTTMTTTTTTTRAERHAELRARLLALRAESMAMWGAAVAHADDEDEDYRRRARDDRADARSSWRRALIRAANNDPAGSIEELAVARARAAEWGDDAPEQAAIAALREVV